MGRCVGRDAETHQGIVSEIASAISGDARPIFDALVDRMKKLSAMQRFEEAAELRDRAGSLMRAIHRWADIRALLAAGDLVVATAGRAMLLRHAQLAACVDLDP